MNEYRAIGKLLDQRFLTYHEAFDSETLCYDFGVVNDVVQRMDLLTLAFRCDQTTGARLVVSSIALPYFDDNEVRTEQACFELTRYRLVVQTEKAKLFCELLEADMGQVDQDEYILIESRKYRLVQYQIRNIWWFIGAGSVEFVLAATLASMGVYLSEQSSVALWATLPMTALFLLRSSISFVKSWYAFKKTR